MTVTAIPASTLSIVEQAKAEIAKEKAEKAKRALVSLLREIDAAETVVRGLRIKQADLEQQINDGTL